MAEIIILPRTIKINKEDYINDTKAIYLQQGYSEYASTLYAEQEAHEMWQRIFERKK